MLIAWVTYFPGERLINYDRIETNDDSYEFDCVDHCTLYT